MYFSRHMLEVVLISYCWLSSNKQNRPNTFNTALMFTCFITDKKGKKDRQACLFVFVEQWSTNTEIKAYVCWPAVQQLAPSLLRPLCLSELHRFNIQPSRHTFQAKSNLAAVPVRKNSRTSLSVAPCLHQGIFHCVRMCGTKHCALLRDGPSAEQDEPLWCKRKWWKAEKSVCKHEGKKTKQKT